MIFIKNQYLEKNFSFFSQKASNNNWYFSVEHIHKQNSHLYEILHFTGFAADFASGWNVTLDIYSFLLFHLIQILHMNVYGPKLFATQSSRCAFFYCVKCHPFETFMTRRAVQVSSAIFLAGYYLCNIRKIGLIQEKI